MLKTVFTLLTFVFILNCGSGSSVESYVHKADKLLEESNVDDALVLYQKGIKKHPKAAELYINQAALYRKKQMYKNALRNYQAVKKINPGSHWSYLGMAKVYIDQKDYTTALSTLKISLEKFPKNGPLLFYTGRAYYENKQADLAIKYFDEALDAKYKKMENVYYYRGLTFETLLHNKARAKMDYESYLLSKGKKSNEIKMRMEALDGTKYEF
jgi:tetratricopeptide (TPR) repeat protein